MIMMTHLWNCPKKNTTYAFLPFLQDGKEWKHCSACEKCVKPCTWLETKSTDPDKMTQKVWLHVIQSPWLIFCHSQHGDTANLAVAAPFLTTPAVRVKHRRAASAVAAWDTSAKLARSKRDKGPAGELRKESAEFRHLNVTFVINCPVCVSPL